MLDRKSGEVRIKHTEEYEGVPYDPRLFDHGEVEEFWDFAVRAASEPSPTTRFRKLLREAERIRSAKEWPVFKRLGQLLSNRKYDVARKLLESIGLGPGDPDYDDLEARIAELQEIRADAAEREHELRKRRLMAKLAAEGAREKRAQQVARMIQERRRPRVAKVGDDPSVMIDVETGRWVPAAEPHGVSFIDRANAFQWARHIEGKPHEARDRRLLGALLTADRRAAQRRGITPTPGPPKRG